MKCKCGEVDNGVYYAPTWGFMEWKCPNCDKIIDLEEYSGIDALGCATTEYGVRAVEEFKKNKRESLK